MRPQIVLFGDDHTENAFTIANIHAGWAAMLAKTYSRKADIMVRGYSQYNTRLALLLLDRIFPLNVATPPTATTVFFGGNDAVISGRSSGHLHVSTVQYRENLRSIVTRLQQCSPGMLVVLITPLPVNDVARQIYAGNGVLQQGIQGLPAPELGQPDRTNLITGLYAQRCIDLAADMGIPCVDLWNGMRQTENWEGRYLSDDGLHLTHEGNRYVHNAVSAVLRDRGLRPLEMLSDFPLAEAIDFNNPENAFQQ